MSQIYSFDVLTCDSVFDLFLVQFEWLLASWVVQDDLTVSGLDVPFASSIVVVGSVIEGTLLSLFYYFFCRNCIKFQSLLLDLFLLISFSFFVCLAWFYRICQRPLRARIWPSLKSNSFPRKYAQGDFAFWCGPVDQLLLLFGIVLFHQAVIFVLTEQNYCHLAHFHQLYHPTSVHWPNQVLTLSLEECQPAHRFLTNHILAQNHGHLHPYGTYSIKAFLF